MFGSTFGDVKIDFDFLRPKIDFDNFLCCLIFRDQNQLVSLELILEKIKIYYFISELLLEKLSNINYFILKLILTKLIQIKFVLPKINSINIKSKRY